MGRTCTPKSEDAQREKMESMSLLGFDGLGAIFTLMLRGSLSTREGEESQNSVTSFIDGDLPSANT